MEWDSNPRPKTAGFDSLRQRLRPLGHPSVSGFCGFSLCYNQPERPGMIVSCFDLEDV
jgi:hypothetical protein